MTRRKLSAVMLAAGLSVAWSCGGGSNNADNSANNPSSNAANNENNTSNAANNANNTEENGWEATITGLENEENLAPPAEGFGGPKVVKTMANLIGNNGSGADPQQTFRITASSGSDFDATGEVEVSLLISWGEPRIECISNLDDKANPVGATLNITSADPIIGTFTADIDCYLQSDNGTNAVAAQISGSLEAVPGL